MRKGLAIVILLGAGGYLACMTAEESSDENANNTRYNRDAGPGGIQLTGCSTATRTMTVAQAATSPSRTDVTILDAVVVALDASATSANFWIQDPNGGRGVLVYRGKNDTAPIPAVGDLISVCGRLKHYNGPFEITSATTASPPSALSIVIKSHEGRTTGGAYPPAGTPRASNPSDFAMNVPDNQPDVIGHVLKFAGPLETTDARAIMYTTTGADGGTYSRPEGFAVTGGLVVNDQNVYSSCMKQADGGVLSTFPNGIRGVWDRYQDFNAGSADSPAPTVPVLYPITCADLNPQ